MKKSSILIATAASLLLASCSMTTPVCATSNPLGTKTGKAKATAVFGISISGDASLQKACKQGGITKVSTVDLKRANYLFVQRTICIVNGE
jgi:peroxiredoxin